jgi:hypothetical protein
MWRHHPQKKKPSFLSLFGEFFFSKTGNLWQNIQFSENKLGIKLGPKKQLAQKQFTDMTENICSTSEVAPQEKGKTGWNSVYHENWLVEKLVCIRVISFCKIFIASYAFDALLLFSPASRMTLRITTLLCIESNKELIVSWSPPINMKVETT